MNAPTPPQPPPTKADWANAARQALTKAMRQVQSMQRQLEETNVAQAQKPGPCPTAETVGMEIMLSILTKLLTDSDGLNYVDLGDGVFDVRVDLTDEEIEFLQRLRTTLDVGRPH